jgi:hypothetical protein
MYLNRKDIEKILDVLNKFPEVTNFELDQEMCGGIGTIISMTFDQTVNEVNGAMTIEISGVKDW